MKKSKFNLKNISGNFLLICGLVTALCTTWTQVKDTFFKAEEKPVAMASVAKAPEQPMMMQTIQGMPPGATVSKTVVIPVAGGIELSLAASEHKVKEVIPPLLKSPKPISAPEAPVVAQSAPEVKKSYLWIGLLVVSLVAMIGGYILRKQIVKEVKEI